MLDSARRYATDIHFQKCYGVMTEVFEAHQSEKLGTEK